MPSDRTKDMTREEYLAYRKEKKRRYQIKKRRRRRIKRVIISLLFILAVLVGHSVARLQLKFDGILNSMEREPENDLSSIKINEIDLVSDKEVINLLLIGSDKRPDWKQTGRSDSTMIATIDMRNKELKLTSLMRDMYVSIPGYEKNRFNAAYSFGGVGLLYQTIATNFELKLDGYVVVDFSAFENVINAMGGVEITLTDAEQEYLVKAYKKGDVHKVKKGLNNLNGKQALAYTRIRQDAKGDFGRTERQRKVLQAIFTKAKSMSMNDLFELAEKIMPCIATDLTNDEIYSYLKTVLFMGTTEISQFRIPIDHSYTNERIRNMAVLVPDLDVNKQALHEFIFQ